LKLSFAIATTADAAEIARLSTMTNQHLQAKHGRITSKCLVTERTVLTILKTSQILVANFQNEMMAMLCLSKKKPWAIDPAYFTPVPRPLYLTHMAVAPERQRQGIGRNMLDQALLLAAQWPGDAIRLDAYDNESGAGGFYEKCGFREVGRVSYRRTPLIYFEFVL
jgi:ribosomal protein S18 acetylase RimI-like enzyme